MKAALEGRMAKYANVDEFRIREVSQKGGAAMSGTRIGPLDEPAAGALGKPGTRPNHIVMTTLPRPRPSSTWRSASTTWLSG